MTPWAKGVRQIDSGNIFLCALNAALTLSVLLQTVVFMPILDAAFTHTSIDLSGAILGLFILVAKSAYPSLIVSPILLVAALVFLPSRAGAIFFAAWAICAFVLQQLVVFGLVIPVADLLEKVR